MKFSNAICFMGVLIFDDQFSQDTAILLCVSSFMLLKSI